MSRLAIDANLLLLLVVGEANREWIDISDLMPMISRPSNFWSKSSGALLWQNPRLLLFSHHDRSRQIPAAGKNDRG